MSFLTNFDDFIVIGSGNVVAQLNLKEKIVAKKIFNWEDVKEENIKKGDEKEENNKYTKKKPEEIVILCIAKSNGPRKLLAVGTNEKLVHILEISNDFSSISHILAVITPKAPTSCVFDKTDSYVIVGDRAGDVHKFSVSDGTINELAGAISMVLDVKIIENGQRLLMADRDEKLRVLRYPETYVIESFCLGHTEYVRSVVSEGNDVAWSSGGDGTLKKWNINTGKNLKSIDVAQENKKAVRKIALNLDKTKIGVLLEKDETFYEVNVESGKIDKIDIKSTSELIDVIANEHGFVVLNRSEVILIGKNDKKIQKFEVNEELKKSLEKVNDAIENFYKNVTFNNQEEYEKRKHEKFAKVDEKKALKRKVEDS